MNQSSMDEKWLLQQLKARNNRETVPFLLIHEEYNRLLLQVDTLQSKLEASERQNSYLQQQLDDSSTAAAAVSGGVGKGGSGGGGGSSSSAYSAAMRNEARIRDKLEKLQEEYNIKVKSEAEEKASVVRLNKELSEMIEENTAQTGTIANLQEENTKAEKTIQHLTNECSEANSRAELAEKQYEGLKMTIRALQQENDDLQKENRQLENRVVTEKSKLLSEVGSLTEMVEALRKERDMLRSLQQQQQQRQRESSVKKQEPKKKSSWFGGLSPSMTTLTPSSSKPTATRPTTTIEEDPGRKFGDLKAVVPTEPKFSLAAHSSEGICVHYDSGSSGSGSDLVVTAGSDATVKVWDTSKGNLKSTFRGSSGHPFLGCDISGPLVAGGSTDKTCRVWHLKKDRMVRIVPFGHVLDRANNHVLTFSFALSCRCINWSATSTKLLRFAFVEAAKLS